MKKVYRVRYLSGNPIWLQEFWSSKRNAEKYMKNLNLYKSYPLEFKIIEEIVF